MTTFKRIATVAALLVASSAHAAGTLLTAPVYDGVGLLDCRAVNVGASTIRIIVEARDYDGAVLDAFGPVYLEPHQVTGSSPLKPGAATCAFVLVEGKPGQVRAAANYHDASSNLVIVPAR